MYDRWRRASAELEELGRTEQEKLRLSDLWSFQRKEIEAAAPRQGEDAELENERRVLRNVVRVQEAAGAAYAALYEDPHSAAAQMRTVEKRLEELARYDEGIRGIVATLQPASIAVDEAAHALRHYLGNIEADPARLDAVEERLATIEKLKRKYGATLADVLAFLETVKADLAAVETSGERRESLEQGTRAAFGILRIGCQEALRSSTGRGPRVGKARGERAGFARHGKDASGDSSPCRRPGPRAERMRSSFCWRPMLARS